MVNRCKITIFINILKKNCERHNYSKVYITVILAHFLLPALQQWLKMNQLYRYDSSKANYNVNKREYAFFVNHIRRLQHLFSISTGGAITAFKSVRGKPIFINHSHRLFTLNTNMKKCKNITVFLKWNFFYRNTKQNILKSRFASFKNLRYRTIRTSLL